MDPWLYSIVVDLRAQREATLPSALGPFLHAAFLTLIKQFDAALSARLHDEPGYRPFTVSSLAGIQQRGTDAIVQEHHCYRLRITLFDGGPLWEGLATYFLAHAPLALQLGSVPFHLIRMYSTRSTAPTAWVQATTWQALAALPPRRFVTVHFASPTAFSLGNRRFELFPHPRLLWEGLLRCWNSYAPPSLSIEKQLVREWVAHAVAVRQCQNLHVETLRFPTHVQKGFRGTCRYEITAPQEAASALTTLAAFAFYAGVGYKTTMAMGQVRVTFDDQEEDVPTLDRREGSAPPAAQA